LIPGKRDSSVLKSAGRVVGAGRVMDSRLEAYDEAEAKRRRLNVPPLSEAGAAVDDADDGADCDVVIGASSVGAVDVDEGMVSWVAMAVEFLDLIFVVPPVAKFDG
jgi:hypothetical protein